MTMNVSESWRRSRWSALRRISYAFAAQANPFLRQSIPPMNKEPQEVPQVLQKRTQEYGEDRQEHEER